MSKRGNGEGSIYRRSDGMWVAAVSVDGKRRVFYGSTRAKANEKLKRAFEDVRNGTLTDPTRLTVGEFLEGWLEDTARPRIRPLTYASYKVNVRHVRRSAVARVPLNKLTPPQVQAFLNRKLADGLSGKTVSYIRQTLRTALNDAVRWNLVPRNVAAVVPAPRKQYKEITPLQPEEIGVLLEAIRDSRHRPLYITALGLGLRQGEVLGLKWSDVDLERGTLRVQRQLQRFEGKLTISEPKSKQARRALDVPAFVAEALRDQQLRLEDERQFMGERWQEHDFVFPNTFGGPIEARVLLRDFRRRLDPVGLAHIRFHDLRHSCATMLLVEGVPPRVVMEILGHSEIRLTMETYSHVIPALRRDAADRIDGALRRATAPRLAG